MEVNVSWWEKALEYHLGSSFYDVETFKGEPTKLTLGSLEMEEMGNVKDKSILHLQCHFGLDTLSWQRLGARCTGVDFSPKAIAAARKLNIEAALAANFVCSDVYNIETVLNNKFDIVFSSYGVLSWLKNIDEYARVVSSQLKSGGFYYLAEIHPIFNLFDIGEDIIKRKYESGAIISQTVSSYTEVKKTFSNLQICYSYTLSGIINALIKAGLTIDFLNEYNYSTYKFHEKLKKVEGGLAFIEDAKYPLIFSLKAHKN